jgi:hypothetical protein
MNEQNEQSNEIKKEEIYTLPSSVKVYEYAHQLPKRPINGPVCKNCQYSDD